MAQIESNTEQEALPFVAPCRQVDVTDPIHWLKLGWEDFKQAPRISLIYGFALIILSYIVAFFTWELGGYVLILSLMSGFIFIAPVLALGLYSISCQLQAGMKPQLGYCLRQGRRHLGSELVYSMILLVIFLLWARAASMIHVFFPMEADPQLTDLATFLVVGSTVGTLFATLVFSASAFSLPMMLDRKVDTITAVITSVNAVLRNKGAMFVWALFIVFAVGICFATALLGMAVIMPVLGYTTWHAYQATIKPEAWPENSKVPTD
jgi:uncharacterized membrane protein